MIEEMNSTEKAAWGMEQISNYIDKLKFKGAVVGGVDKEDVFVSIQEIYRMFKNVYSGLEEEHQLAIQQLTEEQQNNTVLRELTADQEEKLRENVERLRDKLDAEAREKAEEHIRYKLEGYENQLKTAEEALRTANQKSEEHIAQLKLQHEAELEAAKAEISAKSGELERTGTMLETAKTELESQISILKAQISKAEAELTRKDSEHARELELAKVGSVAKGETLEEIYLEARQARDKALSGAKEEEENLLAAAKTKAESIVKEATDEMNALREKTNAEIADALEQNELAVLRTKQSVEEMKQDAQEHVDSMLRDATEKAERIGLAAGQRSEATDAHCQELLEEAIAKVNAATEKADEIIAAAKGTYKRERAKYNDYLLKLGELRAKTVSDINSAVSKLSGLAFDMSGSGVRTDTSNDCGLSDMDESVAEMEQTEAEQSDRQEEEVHEQTEIIEG